MKAPATAALTLSGLILSFSAGASPAEADTVTLNNGREIHGRLIEEADDSIQIRTGSGVITIPKFKIATFSENENWGASKPRSVSELKAIDDSGAPKDDAPKVDAPKGDAPKGGAPKGDGPKGDAPKAGGKDWTWGKGVDAATIEQLTPVRDELLKELEALGPTKEERLAKLALSREEEPDLKEKIRLMGWLRRRGGKGGTSGSAVYRDRARAEVVETYGPRAIEQLAKSLQSENLWQVRTVAATLKEIQEKAKEAEDTRWLMFHFGVPEALLAMIDNESDPTSPFVRLEGSEALATVLGAPIEWPAGANTPFRTPMETAARKKAQSKVAQLALTFRKDQEEKAAKREALNGKLALVREGKDPNAEEGE